MIATDAITRTEQIARLNDRCRQGFDRTARTIITRSCMAALGAIDVASRIVAQARAMRGVRNYVFPSGAHPSRDRGDFELSGTCVYFVIDYYDLALEYGSENPADTSVTTGVMTIMLREDL